MYDEKKVSLVKKVGIASICLLFLIVSFSAGFTIGGKQSKPTEIKPVKLEKTQEKTLSTQRIEQFLIAYYTKKDLGENQNRYKPFVTSGLFNELKANEALPINQAYQGYIVNQVFNQADIFINEKENSAICVVQYQNTQRVKKNSDDGALKNQSNEDCIKISFVRQGKKYLADRIENIALSQPESKHENAFPEKPKLPEKKADMPTIEEKLGEGK